MNRLFIYVFSFILIYLGIALVRTYVNENMLLGALGLAFVSWGGHLFIETLKFLFDNPIKKREVSQ